MVGEIIKAIFESGGLVAFLGAVAVLAIVAAVMAAILLVAKRSVRLAWNSNGKAVADSLAILPAILQQGQADHIVLTRAVDNLTDINRSMYGELRSLTEAMHSTYRDTQRELSELTRAVILRKTPRPEPDQPQHGQEGG